VHKMNAAAKQENVIKKKRLCSQGDKG